MNTNSTTTKHNFYALLWHSGFLAFAQNFMDVNTIVPTMLVDAGGNAIHIGVMTAIMLGGASMTQLFFAPFISNFPYKKWSLLVGINSRILSLAGLGLILFFSSRLPEGFIIGLIFLSLSIFSLGGAFANVSYTDILGKSLALDSRKPFFSLKQVTNGIILFLSALLAKKLLTLTDYPINYSYMFFIAFVALFIASLGLWSIRETAPSQMKVAGARHFLQLVKIEIRKNPRLKYFLGLINTFGVTLALLPFVILYTKEIHHIPTAEVGLFLLYKVTGSVLTGFILFSLAGKYRYRDLLYGSALLSFLLPILLFLKLPFSVFPLVFFIGGIIYSGYAISISGVLLEMSGDANRALYTGIVGAGNVIPALFPLFGGVLIRQFGFQPFFILFMAIMLSSLFFIYKINCHK